MVKRTISSIIFALLVGVCISWVASDRAIRFDELPSRAQKFIHEHFPKLKISIVRVDAELLSKSYEVIFSDGTKVEFDRRGRWQDVDSKYSSVPLSIIPSKIVEYVRTHFPSMYVTQIDRQERGYVVELSNDIDLYFDNEYKFIGVEG